MLLKAFKNNKEYEACYEDDLRKDSEMVASSINELSKFLPGGIGDRNPFDEGCKNCTSCANDGQPKWSQSSRLAAHGRVPYQMNWSYSM